MTHCDSYISPKTFIGQSKHTITQTLQAQGADYVEFLHWIIIPQSHSVLSFNKQICQNLDIMTLDS